MPVPLCSGIRELPSERMGKLNAGLVLVAIILVDLSNALNMKPKRLDESRRKEGDSVSGALPFPNDHLITAEVEILNS